MVLSLSSVIADLKASLARHLAVRMAIAELRGMDDTSLADLGIGRDEIRAYACGSLSRPAIHRPRPMLRVIDGGRTRPAPTTAPARLRLLPAGA